MRAASHDVRLRRVADQRDGGSDVGDEIDPENLKRQER